jgi:hypothetical protein
LDGAFQTGQKVGFRANPPREDPTTVAIALPAAQMMALP